MHWRLMARAWGILKKHIAWGILYRNSSNHGMRHIELTYFMTPKLE